jgi:hypothetical protein
MERLTKSTIADAVWASDALADEGHSLPEIVRMANISFEDAMYVAQQRALRIILMQRGDAAVAQMKRDAYEQYSRTVKLARSEGAQQALLATIWLDAFTAGVRAANATGKDA